MFESTGERIHEENITTSEDQPDTDKYILLTSGQISMTSFSRQKTKDSQKMSCTFLRPIRDGGEQREGDTGIKVYLSKVPMDRAA